MHLIIGGVYQGKRQYMAEHFKLSDDSIFSCTGAVIDFEKDGIYGLDVFSLACTDLGIDPVEYFDANRDKWKNAVISSADISCGVVPINKTHRLWREVHGRLLMYLASNAESVTRMFCGLPQVIK